MWSSVFRRSCARHTRDGGNAYQDNDGDANNHDDDDDDDDDDDNNDDEDEGFQATQTSATDAGVLSSVSGVVTVAAIFTELEVLVKFLRR